MGGPSAWQRMDRALARFIALLGWLVLPVSLLLFLQWPLRDFVRQYSREANDFAQWLFALYVAVAITQATRARAHLAIPGIANHFSPAMRARLARCGAAFATLPFALFILLTGAPATWQSLRGLESFPDTFNPGYCMVKLAAWLLALLLAMQAVLDVFAPRED